jgi:protein-L-isoaspartate(D-aspartate) O-methyltransferase
VSDVKTAPRGVHPREPICPECGFDVSSQEPCKVCGYDPRRDLAPPRPLPGATRLPFFYLIALLMIFSTLFVVTALTRQSQPGQSTGETVASKTITDSAASAAPQSTAKAQVAAKPSVAAQETKPKADPPPAPNKESAPRALTQVNRTARPGAYIPDAFPSSDESYLFDITRRDFHPPLSNREEFVSWMLAHTRQQEKYLGARWDRAQIILQIEQITHERVLEAFLMTPREYFCRDTRRAYESAALPIGYGQTISGPHMVARMTDYLNPQPDQKVLEIGTGSGYQSAVLSELSLHVFTIEIVKELAQETNEIYLRYENDLPEYGNIKRKVDDGYYGWIEYAPFNRIIVTCGIDHIPPELLKQLAPDGIMVIPVGPPSGQTILRIVKRVAPDGTVSLEREDIFHGRRKEIFVPFTAKEGGVHSEAGGSASE